MWEDPWLYLSALFIIYEGFTVSQDSRVSSIRGCFRVVCWRKLLHSRARKEKKFPVYISLNDMMWYILLNILKLFKLSSHWLTFPGRQLANFSSTRLSSFWNPCLVWPEMNFFISAQTQITTTNLLVLVFWKVKWTWSYNVIYLM